MNPNENPGPGVKFCPVCLRSSLCFNARWVGKASDNRVEIQCPKPDCGAVFKKLLNWNEARERVAA